MALTKVINDLADLNQSGSTNALKGCAGTTAQQPASSSSIDYLIVGGGGGAGGGKENSWGGGGGGAGGYLTGSTTIYHGTPTVITVGEGGDGNNVRTAAGFNGDDSGFNGIRAIGGGGGGAENIDAVNGASGGGAGGNLSGTPSQPGSGVSGQGNAGGGVASPINGSASGGGGGGAVGLIPSTSSVGGAGGIGVDQTGFISVVNANLAQIGDTSNATQVMISGGGGGASDYQATGTGGAGGLGGGGDGGTDGSATNGDGFDGMPNTGGGGGGGNAKPTPAANYMGGTGGSGVAILKYDNTIVTGYTLNSEDTYTANWPADKFGIGYWPLNLNINEASGNYNSTVLIGSLPTYVNGKFNQAAKFTTSDGIDTGCWFHTDEPFTMCVWIKNDSWYSGFSSIIGKMYAFPSYQGAAIIQHTGLAYFSYNGTTTASSYTLPVGEWVHLGITYDGGTSCKFYANGVLQFNDTATPSNAHTTNFVIGDSNIWVGTQATMEQVRVYTSELAASDMLNIYNNSKPGSLPPLKTSSDLTTDVCNFPTGVTGGGFYDFIGTANDTCGNNNGTFTNSSYSSTIAKFGQSAGPFVYNSAAGSETRIYTGAGNEVTTTEGNKTLSAWVYPTTNMSTQSGGFIVFANGKITISYINSSFIAYKYSNGNDIFSSSCSGDPKSITSFADYPVDNWYHVAVVMSGTGDYDFKLYVNGIYINGTQGSTTFCGYDNSVNGGFIIGSSYYYSPNNAYYNGFDGYIDRVRVYASALTDQNIYDLWQKENNIQTYITNTTSSTDANGTPANTDILVFKEGSGELTFKNDSPPGAEIGMLRYNSTLNKMEHFNSGGWKDFSYCTTDLCDYPTQANSVLLYRFNDDVTDTCGAYNGTAGGSLSYTTGKFGKAIDTTSGYVDTGYIFPADSTMSVSFWMKMTANPGSDVYMLSDMDSGTSNRRLDIRIAGAYGNKLYIDNGDGSSNDQEDTGWVPTNDVWYHIVVTFNGTAGILYVDGVSTYSYTSTVALGTAGGQTQVIGRAGHYPCCNFPGLIDQFRLFTSTLTADEVLDLYNEVQC